MTNSEITKKLDEAIEKIDESLKWENMHMQSAISNFHDLRRQLNDLKMKILADEARKKTNI